MRVVRPRSGVSPRSLITGIIVLTVVLWFLLGGPFYIVAPEEEGVVLTFGRHTGTVGPGFHLKFPWPIQVVYKPAVNIIRRIEIGFRTIQGTDPPEFRGFARDAEMLQEAQMLTGDENIINCAAIIQYRIKDSADFLFNVRDQDGTLRDISEASIRLIIGDNSVDAVLTTGKLELQNRILEQVQRRADNYGLGVTIVAVQLMDVQPPNEVSAAFKDVATAREDMQAYINNAQGYRNQVIPAAIADSVTLVNAALGYSAIRINEALGESSRFIAVAEEYRKSPEVTTTRLQLEAMHNILSKVQITVVDASAGALTHYNLGGGQ
jgi:membrane protease subunit HflK